MPRTREINRAIYEAIAKCHASPTPFECLAEEIDRLGGRRDWATAEIEVVAEKALRMLAILLEPPHEPCENSQEPVRALRLHIGQ